MTYVVNRNINYTNICTYKCSFCAFSKSAKARHLRGTPYVLAPEEVGARTRRSLATRGATEVCMQGGIHPSYTGDTYLSILNAVKRACPSMHVHAFSPLEVSSRRGDAGHLASRDYLLQLKDAGLGSLPGTAAEILDDEVRAHHLPGQAQHASSGSTWSARRMSVGLPTTATIMFGHVDSPSTGRGICSPFAPATAKTGGFTEFVPLPFVHMEAPMYQRGQARRGPTWREAVLMHAVARSCCIGADRTSSAPG